MLYYLVGIEPYPIKYLEDVPFLLKTTPIVLRLTLFNICNQHKGNLRYTDHKALKQLQHRDENGAGNVGDHIRIPIPVPHSHTHLGPILVGE